MTTIKGKVIRKTGREYLIHSENDRLRTAAPIAFGGEAIIVITPPIFAEYAIPKIRNFDSAVITLILSNPSNPKPNGIIIAVAAVLLTQHALREVANIRKIAAL